MKIPKTTKISKCRLCADKKLLKIYSFGNMLVSNFVSKKNIYKGTRAPLNLVYCKNCKLLQLQHSAPQEIMYKKFYWYRSGITKTMKNALKDIFLSAKKMSVLNKGDTILDIGANDGTLLNYFKKEKYITIGCEPAKNLTKHLRRNCKYILNNFWNSKDLKKINDIKSLDAVIMFTPNDQCIFGLGKVSRDFMDLAFSKKITLVGPAMIYFVLKAVDANWKADKQSKNLKQVIEIADKVCSQAVEIYESAKNSKDSIEETIKSLDKVLSKIQDGRGSFLGRIKNMIKIGGFTPKKSIPFDAKEHIESDNVQTIAAKEVDKDE